MADPHFANWELISSLVGELAELPSAEREARIEVLDDPIRQSVRDLLAAHDASAHLFDRSAPDWLDMDGESTDPGAMLGQRLGPWRLVALVGQGGMGAVYRAERDEGGFRQEAAIKMLHPDLLPGVTLDRFRRERQLLARLRHRNIATLLDGGVTAEGRPWFAMELVDGEPITAWCNRHRLAPTARLKLVRQVCGAIQHAHRELVVHRDLKPGNILVTNDGTVKLLDFGVAKLLDDDAGDSHDDTITRWGGTPATPNYASPEQLDGATITTASDIYSLGVVIHELLTGAVPFAAGDDRAAHRRRVMHDEPPALAQSFRANMLPAMGGWRESKLRRWLAGDIARVIDMALRKAPERRYSSAEQLAIDLDAVITGKPVMARPDSAMYRLRRLMARNPVATLVTLLLGVGLIAAAAVALDRARRAEVARVEAAAEAARSERVTTFLSEVLTSPDPWTGNREVTVREVLDEASERASRDFGDDPAVEARVRVALARSYRGLGQGEDALREFTAAEKLSDPSSRFAALRGLGELSADLGDAVAARNWYRLASEAAGSDSLEIATVAADLAWLHGIMGHADSARSSAELAVAIRRRHGSAPVELANALNNLAVVELQAGQPDAAIPLMDEAVSLLRSAGRAGEPPLGTALAVLAGVHTDRGDYQLADTLYRESLSLRRRIFGAGHPDEVATLVNIAVNNLDLQQPHAALAVTDTIFARTGERALPITHPLVAAARTARGRALGALGQHGAALVELESALALRRAALPTGHPALAFTLSALAESYHALGRKADARAAAVEAYGLLRDALGEEHPRTVAAGRARSNLGP